jgi:hypothetical protein
MAPTSAALGGDGSPAAAVLGAAVPADAQRLIDGVVRSRANSTDALIQALRVLEDFGLDPAEAARVGFGQFPIGGRATWSHDWMYPRFVPSFHLHEGTDLFAPQGTPVRAPVTGSLRMVKGAISGLAAYVTAPDRTYYFLGHLQAFADGLVEGQTVEQGQVLGFVGATGNAAGTPAHVHFEIHPRGGAPMDPKETLDRWVADAIAAVPELVARYQSSTPRALLATGLTRRLEAPMASTTAPARFSGPLLWASSVSPTGGVAQMAEILAVEAARTVDWDAVVRQTRTSAEERTAATRRARALLRPLTPPALLPFLAP